MPLLDHFHRPIYPLFPWESFLSLWAGEITAALNATLRRRYFATVQVHLGRHVEADVVEFERAEPPLEVDPSRNGHGNVATVVYAPPLATGTLPAVFPDAIEVQINDTRDGAVVVGVIELVSPGNKDRDDAARAFTAKCAAYLQRGIGLVVVDIVTARRAGLFGNLIATLGQASETPPELHAAAYAPMRRDERNEIDYWLSPLELGQPLPTLPLALRGAGFVPVDLETTYTSARNRSRL